MKAKQLIVSGNSMESPLEKIIETQDAELKGLALKKAKHFAKCNLPAPKKDYLSNYTGEVTAGYKRLIADALHYIQPGANLPESKMEAKFFEEKDIELEREIRDRENQNRNDEFDLNNHSSNNLVLRIVFVLLASLVIYIGEVVYSSKSFQITGDNYLMSLIMAISICFVMNVFSHVAAFRFKAAQTTNERRLIAAGALGLATIVFFVMAILRSEYLATHDVHISPIYFVLFNLMFFITSAGISTYFLPSYAEIKQNMKAEKMLRVIEKRKSEIKALKVEREKIKEEILEKTKERVRIGYYTGYIIDRIKMMHLEAIELFKSTNITYRSDREVPDCFSEQVVEFTVDDFHFNLINTNQRI